MKKILSILFLITLSINLGLTQSEVQQKLKFRSTKTTTNRNTTQTYQIERTQKNDIRYNNNQTRPIHNRNDRVVYGRPNHPYWFNRWGRFNHPRNGYLYYDNWYWYDNGYRQPARIYVYPEGKRDTIIRDGNIIRLGVQYGTQNQIGGWITIGKKIFFIGEYNSSINNDQSEYYDEITMDYVSSWNDVRLTDITKNRILYLGVGSMFNSFGINLSVGMSKNVVNYQFFDETMILSNNGRYSFKNYSNNNTSLKIGGLFDYKNMTIKTDYDFIMENLLIGLGVNF